MEKAHYAIEVLGAGPRRFLTWGDMDHGHNDISLGYEFGRIEAAMRFVTPRKAAEEMMKAREYEYVRNHATRVVRVALSIEAVDEGSVPLVPLSVPSEQRYYHDIAFWSEHGTPACSVCAKEFGAGTFDPKREMCSGCFTKSQEREARQ